MIFRVFSPKTRLCGRPIEGEGFRQVKKLEAAVGFEPTIYGGFAILLALLAVGLQPDTPQTFSVKTARPKTRPFALFF